MSEGCEWARAVIGRAPHPTVWLFWSQIHELRIGAGSPRYSGSHTSVKFCSWRWARGPATRSSRVYIWRRVTELPMKRRSLSRNRQRDSPVSTQRRPHPPGTSGA
eukprot:scaffold34880_cov101-Isochrysis_galbana.AAC.1